jgi:hypothetical protein
VNRRPIQADIQCAQCLLAAGAVDGKLLGAGGSILIPMATRSLFISRMTLNEAAITAFDEIHRA